MYFNPNAKNVHKSCLRASEYVKKKWRKISCKENFILLVDSVRTLCSHGGNIGAYFILGFNAA